MRQSPDFRRRAEKRASWEGAVCTKRLSPWTSRAAALPEAGLWTSRPGVAAVAVGRHAPRRPDRGLGVRARDDGPTRLFLGDDPRCGAIRERRRGAISSPAASTTSSTAAACGAAPYLVSVHGALQKRRRRSPPLYVTV